MGPVRLLMIAVLVLVSPATAIADTVPSTIGKVTLFTGQALVEREGEATVAKGINTLVLAVSAFHVDPDSVTATVFGKGELLSVQLVELPVAQTPQAQVRSIENKLIDLSRERARHMDRKQALEKKAAFLDAVIDFSKVQVPRDMQTKMPSPEALNHTLGFLDNGYDAIHRERQQIDAAVRDLDDQIQALKKELAMLRSGRPDRVTRGIEVVFDSQADQRVRCRVAYLSRDATWQPVYKAAIADAMDHVDLTLFSRIVQKSGEDWDNVRLSVSNVVPMKGVTPPELPPWRLDMPRPVARKSLARSPMMLDTMATAQEMVAAAPEPDAEAAPAAFAAAQRRRLPLSFEYDIRHPVTIASREKDTLLPLFTKRLDGDFFYYAVPRRYPLPFLVCRTAADRELLAGDLNVYFAGRFVGKTRLAEKKAGTAFRLGLGVDRELKVRREKTRDKIKETYFGKIERDTVVRELSYTIRMENLKDRPVTLEVLDGIPVSQTDKIEVRDVRLEPAPTDRDYQDRQGVMRWRRQLAAGEKAEITISFVLAYPRGYQPPGL